MLALDPYVTDWLNLLLRWLHVVAAIAWIGSSFYFIWLDNHLQATADAADALALALAHAQTNGHLALNAPKKI